MKNRYTLLICFVLFMSLVSCNTYRSLNQPPSATSTGPRTIVLGGDTISEKDVGGFKSWYCKDFIREGLILVEVGFFGDPESEGIGFVLYDGGFTGEITIYERKGLEHRWDWGDEVDFAFIIKPDGTGLYYDFSKVSEGESTKPSAVYKCYQR